MPHVKENRKLKKAAAPNALTSHLLDRFSKGKTKNAYVEKAVSNARERILSAVRGERNTIINGEIYSLARLTPISSLSSEQIYHELYDDALSLYDPNDRDDASDIRHFGSVFKSAIDAGIKKPKEMDGIGCRRR